MTYANNISNYILFIYGICSFVICLVRKLLSILKKYNFTNICNMMHFLKVMLNFFFIKLYLTVIELIEDKNSLKNSVNVENYNIRLIEVISGL